MTHVMDPTVKIWPGCGRDEEPTEKTILFDKETARTPLPGAPTVDRISLAILLGVRLGKNNQEPKTEPKEPEPKSKEPEPKFLVSCSVLSSLEPN